MIRLVDLLNQINEDTKAAQLRRKKWRMVNEISNQLEFEFSDDTFSQMSDLVKKLGGDLDSLVIREVNEAAVDYQNMPIEDLEKYIQGTLDDTAKREKMKSAIETLVNKNGDEEIKRIHKSVVNKEKGKLSKEDLKKYNDFLAKNAKKTDDKTKADKKAKEIINMSKK